VSSGKTLRILVVDDDRLFREMLADLLQGNGHDVTTAGDGAEGLHKFRSSAFDVVITDLEMPRLSGEELAAAVKACSPGTVVVAVSGDPRLEAARALMAAGCEGLLSKSGLSTEDVLKAVTMGCQRQQAFQAAAARGLLELARREVALGVIEPLESLSGRLERLAGGGLGAEEAARLAAESLAVVRQVRKALETVGREE
jgi:DNA-binding NarL/FixJ family response regulator